MLYEVTVRVGGYIVSAKILGKLNYYLYEEEKIER